MTSILLVVCNEAFEWISFVARLSVIRSCTNVECKRPQGGLTGKLSPMDLQQILPATESLHIARGMFKYRL